MPDKIGEDVRERKEIGGGREGKERNREVVRKRKEIRRELMALDACGSFAICHTVAIYIFRSEIAKFFNWYVILFIPWQRTGIKLVSIYIRM